MKLIEKYGVLIFVLFAIFMFVKPVTCFLILGLSFVYLGIEGRIVLKQIEKHGITTVGKIIKYTRDGKGYQTPTIKFSTDDGKTIEREPYIFTATDFNKFKNYKSDIGKEVEVKYIVQDPEKFTITEENSLDKFGNVFAIIVGTIFTLVAILNLLELMEVNFK